MGKWLITACMIVLVGMLFSPRTNFAQHTDKANPPSGDSKKKSSDSSKQDSASKSDTAIRTDSQSLKSKDRDFVMEAAHSGMAEVELGRLAVERAASDEVKQFGQRMIDDHSRANSELMELASRKGVTLSTDMGAQGSASSTATSTQQTTSGTGMITSGTSSTKTSGGTSTGTQKDTATTQRTGSSDGGSSQSHSGHDDKMMQKHQQMKTRLSGLSGAEFDREYMRHMVKDHDAAVSMFQREASRGSDTELKAWAAKTLPTLQEHLRMAREISGKTGGSGNSTGSKPNSGNN